jgi:DNA-binding NtrC family response regulator
VRIVHHMETQGLEAGSVPANTTMSHNDDLQTDLALAAECDACVLLTAAPGPALELTRTLARYSGYGPNGVHVLDCDAMDAALLGAALHDRARGAPNGRGILLVREVHALEPSSQQLLSELLEVRHRPGTPRLVSSSSVSLFDRVRLGLFDERLFYKLNTIHINVQAGGASD